MDWVIRSIVGFLVVVCIFWCGVSVVQYVRVGEKQLAVTRKGQLMTRTAYGTLVAAGLVVLAALGRLVAGWLGV
jgi:hypothetical protein